MRLNDDSYVALNLAITHVNVAKEATSFIASQPLTSNVSIGLTILHAN